jgi:predicted PhzF superfamily epimerase YddE/YHI9
LQFVAFLNLTQNRWAMTDNEQSEAATSLPLFLVDAFAIPGIMFTGNPAAVVLIPPTSGDRNLSSATMQKIAAEMAQSETAFVEPLEEIDNPVSD